MTSQSAAYKGNRIQGTVGCTAWTSETNRPLKEKSDMKELEKDTQKFYHDLFSSPPLNGTIHPGAADIWNSYELYEYVSYVYTHNQTVHNGLDNANDTLYKLGKYALALQRAQNTKPDGETNETVKELYTIAGRTLAMRIADQLERNIDWDGDRDKLSIMFGSFEPILAFLSVGGLLTRENLLSGPFTRFPEPGAAMIFELISNITEDSDSIPKPEDLRIRFYYRASADENASFEGFSLFGFGNGGKSIPYTAFYREMMEMGVSSEEWCDVCNPATATWCSTGSDSSGEGTGDGSGNGNLTSTSQLHPALAGLIGALIMGAVVSLVAILLFALGGYRIRRVSPEERSRSTHGGGGGGGGSQGFKGPEKKASDADVTVSSVGAQQERVGSWEMKNGGYTVKGLGLRNETRDGYDTDGGVSVMGSAPVRPRESV